MHSDRVNRNYYSDSERSWGFSASEKLARYRCSSLSGWNSSNCWWGQIPLQTRSRVIPVLLMRCLTRHSRSCGSSFPDLKLGPSDSAFDARCCRDQTRFIGSVLKLRSRSMAAGHFVILACLLSDRWRYHDCYYLFRIPVHAELRSEIGLGAAFQLISGEMQRRHDL